MNTEPNQPRHLLRCLILTSLVFTARPAVSAVTIPFVPVPIDALGVDRPDFASLDADPRLALKRDTLNQMNVYDLSRLNQEQLDQVYARLTPGEFPDGRFSEMILQVEGGLISRVAQLTKPWPTVRAVQGATSVASQVTGVTLTDLFKLFWTGKTFYNQDVDDRYVYNRMTYGAISKEVLDLVFGHFGGKLPPRESFWRRQYERFPGKVFCGASLLDSRRESIVIDYAYADDLKAQYLPEVDFLTGRNGFMIRNELRMVNRNIYLGRAYLNRLFVFNFILSKNGRLDTWPINNECWAGSQEQASK